MNKSETFVSVPWSSTGRDFYIKRFNETQSCYACKNNNGKYIWGSFAFTDSIAYCLSCIMKTIQKYSNFSPWKEIQPVFYIKLKELHPSELLEDT